MLEPVLTYYHTQVTISLLLISSNTHILMLIILKEFWKVNRVHALLRLSAIWIILVLLMSLLLYSIKNSYGHVTLYIVRFPFILPALAAVFYMGNVIGFIVIITELVKVPRWISKTFSLWHNPIVFEYSLLTWLAVSLILQVIVLSYVCRRLFVRGQKWILTGWEGLESWLWKTR